MLDLSEVTASGSGGRGRPRASVDRITLRHGVGVLAIVGSERDGTTLLGDLLDGSARPTRGRVLVGGVPAGDPRARPLVARVTLEAPLPELLRVDEVCALAATLRGAGRGDGESLARGWLGRLGVAELARRRTETLTLAERRTVAIAIAIGGPATILAIDEPLGSLAPAAPRLVIDAIREKGTSASILVTTSSARDATALADRLGLLRGGVFTAYDSTVGGSSGHPHVVRVVVSGNGRQKATALASHIGQHAEVRLVETAAFRDDATIALTVSGPDPLAVARAVNAAIASSGVDVDLVQPTPLPADAIRAALAMRAASPPPGSLPPPSLPPGSLAPSSLPPPPPAPAEPA